jgi:hypothetical protein
VLAVDRPRFGEIGHLLAEVGRLSDGGLDVLCNVLGLVETGLGLHQLLVGAVECVLIQVQNLSSHSRLHSSARS